MGTYPWYPWPDPWVFTDSGVFQIPGTYLGTRSGHGYTHEIPGAYFIIIVDIYILDQNTAVSKTFHKPDTLRLNKHQVPGTKDPQPMGWIAGIPG